MKPSQKFKIIILDNMMFKKYTAHCKLRCLKNYILYNMCRCDISEQKIYVQCLLYIETTNSFFLLALFFTLRTLNFFATFISFFSRLLSHHIQYFLALLTVWDIINDRGFILCCIQCWFSIELRVHSILYNLPSMVRSPVSIWSLNYQLSCYYRLIKL